ncbi:hypothetical protein PR048_024607 [Dryococelus australis]|uniref:Uncharacterized protein n=1 Tax=Dryococelus australis TaxID=614101 RepID=A0ABQ9GP51_9NEOP|nr:hypothetical protein PR048_024607 [Dryococelus australis]
MKSRIVLKQLGEYGAAPEGKGVGGGGGGARSGTIPTCKNPGATQPGNRTRFTYVGGKSHAAISDMLRDCEIEILSYCESERALYTHSAGHGFIATSSVGIGYAQTVSHPTAGKLRRRLTLDVGAVENVEPLLEEPRDEDAHPHPDEVVYLEQHVDQEHGDQSRRQHVASHLLLCHLSRVEDNHSAFLVPSRRSCGPRAARAIPSFTSGSPSDSTLTDLAARCFAAGIPHSRSLHGRPRLILAPGPSAARNGRAKNRYIRLRTLHWINKPVGEAVTEARERRVLRNSHSRCKSMHRAWTSDIPEALLKFYFQDIPPPHANTPDRQCTVFVRTQCNNSLYENYFLQGIGNTAIFSLAKRFARWLDVSILCAHLQFHLTSGRMSLCGESLLHEKAAERLVVRSQRDRSTSSLVYGSFARFASRLPLINRPSVNFISLIDIAVSGLECALKYNYAGAIFVKIRCRQASMAFRHTIPGTCVFIGCYPTPGSYGICKVFPCKSAIGSEACRAGLINGDLIANIKFRDWMGFQLQRLLGVSPRITGVHPRSNLNLAGSVKVCSHTKTRSQYPLENCRILSPLHNGASAVCSLAAAPHLDDMGFARCFLASLLLAQRRAGCVPQSRAVHLEREWLAIYVAANGKRRRLRLSSTTETVYRNQSILRGFSALLFTPRGKLSIGVSDETQFYICSVLVKGAAVVDNFAITNAVSHRYNHTSRAGLLRGCRLHDGWPVFSVFSRFLCPRVPVLLHTPRFTLIGKDPEISHSHQRASHWLSAVTVEGDDSASVLQEVPNIVCTNVLRGEMSDECPSVSRKVNKRGECVCVTSGGGNPAGKSSTGVLCPQHATSKTNLTKPAATSQSSLTRHSRQHTHKVTPSHHQAAQRHSSMVHSFLLPTFLKVLLKLYFHAIPPPHANVA